MPQIQFGDRVIECDEGANLRQVALKNDIELYPGIKSLLNCRGMSSCGECRVHILNGQENVSPKGAKEKLRIAVSWFRIGQFHRKSPRNSILLFRRLKLPLELQ